MSRRIRAATFCFLAVVCLTPVAAQAVDVLSGPTLTMDPNGRTPLAGVIELETSRPVRAMLTISNGIDRWNVRFPDVTSRHYLPVLGLKPDRTYTVDVRLNPGGRVGTVFATTPPLPEDFPEIEVVVSKPQKMEAGLTLIDCFRRVADDLRPTYPMIVDAQGEVVWYTTICFAAARQLPNGKIFYRTIAGGGAAVEMDLLGNETRVPLETNGQRLHHDLVRTTHGTYLSLGRLPVEVTDFPTSLSDPEARTELATVRDEPVMEFLPNGALRKQWLLTDLIDPRRIGYDGLNPTPDGIDWAHSNAVVHDPRDDSLIVSLRHQDAVIKFSRDTGELKWILGPHDNWSSDYQPFLLHPVGAPFEWPYHQHAPMITREGTLVLFDNGNHRASPFDGRELRPAAENFSRGVEYEIDEDAMTIRQVWEYGENIDARLYAPFLGDADQLPATGNVLMTFGTVDHVGGVPSADLGLGLLHTRIVEVTDDIVPERVFELLLYEAGDNRVIVYRSERIRGLYAPRQAPKLRTPMRVPARARGR